MKTIVLANLKQVFETIMTLCNILQLRVLSHNKNIVVYSDLFNNEKIIILNKEYSEVIYHNYTNNVHVTYKINNSEKLFIEYYNRYENSTDIISKLNEVIEKLEKDNSDLNEEIETMTNESVEQIDYLNNRIETLKKEYNKKMTENYDLTDKIQSLQYDNDLYSNQLEKVNNKLAYYEIEYMDIVAEKMQQYENQYNKLMTIAKKDRENLKQEINQLNNIINDRDMVINTMKKTITEKENLINSLYNQISSIQYNNQSKIEEMRNEHETLFNDFMNEYSQHSETLNENKKLKKKIKRLYARINKK